MSVIRILPENLANQIAAGEVVERPASVIKELLENAVDAGARNISVQVEGRAVGLLRVSDDGAGMDADDLLLALERHATSKIADAAGLAAINTLGFRGEALPSIASVSRLRLSSRPAGADLGTLVEVRFGIVDKVREAGAAQGTVVEVRDLFANVPARRKFLKTPRTELYHVEECVRNCGLACPGLGLDYRVDGRTVLQWPAGVDDAAGRIRRLLGKRAAAGMIAIGRPVDHGREDEQQDPEVFGLLLAPEDVPATGARLRVFVNGRPVRDRMLTHAVAEGLHNQLLRGRQPAGVIFLRVDPATVDVNVHPTKQEIRLQQPSRVHDAVREEVRRALEWHEKQRSRAMFGQPADRPAAESGPVPVDKPVAGVAGSPAPQVAGPAGTTNSADPGTTPGGVPSWRSPAGSGRLFEVREPGEAKFAADKPGAAADPARWSPDSGQTGPEPEQKPLTHPARASAPASGRDHAPSAAAPSVPSRSSDAATTPAAITPAAELSCAAGNETPETGGEVSDHRVPQVVESGTAKRTSVREPARSPQDAVPCDRLRGETSPRLLGQVLRSYIICATEDGLLAVDQHAAHERLLYERLLAQYNEKGLSRQALLFPAVLECSPAEAAVLADRGEEISRLGLEVEAFGGDSYVIKAVPALLAVSSPPDILAGVLFRFLEGDSSRQPGSRLESVLAGMACKAAVKAGQTLAPEEMRALLSEMQAAGIFSRCPHGRPVVRHFTAEEMNKWFKR